MAEDPTRTEIDPDRLKMFSFQLFTKLEGAITAGLVHLGDRLGLYRALADADGPLTSHGLASVTGLDERYVREWVRNQAAAGLLAWQPADGGGEEYWMTPEATAVMATAGHPAFGLGMFHRLPQTMAMLTDLFESFRTGVGYDYDAHGEVGAAGIERSFEPWYRNHLLSDGLPTLEGVVEKLEGGALLADVGCGAGVAVRLMAQAFPNSRFHGFDISEHALHRAESRRTEMGLDNARFHNVRFEPLPDDGRFDVITTFDCIHDMTRPRDVIAAIRKALADDGTWLLVDIKALDTFAENTRKNPMSSLMYGISIYSCMSSALSEPGGEGLGTLGLPESLARQWAEEAGFTRFRRLDIDHPVNAFYEIRP
jgi:2-polyprenyl-3-methyl-5-hydroxy-6-metoxy-1,4-benzoquinol methylase